MGFVDIYDSVEDTLKFSTQDHFQQRRDMWWELRSDERVRSRCIGQSQSIDNIVNANWDQEATYRQPGQRCGMDHNDRVAIDLRGNVLTCQNATAASVAPNGKSHKIGHVSSLDDVVLDTATHWTMREKCASCPVLRLCGGGCMFSQGEAFEISCEGSYTDRITQFAIAFEQVTGFIPVYIDGEWMPERRKDIWGTRVDRAQEAPVERKVIPIHPV